MMDISYHVAKGSLHNVIYAGKIRKKNGRVEWTSKTDVTNEAISAVLEYFAEETHIENSNGKGMEWVYDNVNGYRITINVDKIEEAIE